MLGTIDPSTCVFSWRDLLMVDVFGCEDTFILQVDTASEKFKKQKKYKKTVT